MMSREIQQLSSYYPFSRDIFVPSSTFAEETFLPYVASQYGYLDQPMYSKVTDEHTEDLSSTSCPTYTVTEPQPPFETPEGFPTSVYEAPGNKGAETHEKNVGSQYIDRLQRHDLSWTEVNTAHPPGISDSSLHSNYFSQDAVDGIMSPSPNERGTSPCFDHFQDYSVPYSRSRASPTTSPSRTLPATTSRIPNAKLDYLGSVSEGHLVGRADLVIPAKEAHVNCNTISQGQDPKCTSFISFVKSLHLRVLPPARQRRRNIQVSSPGAVLPILLRNGAYACPISGCAREVIREQEMQRHIDSHLGKGSMCPICGQIYSRSDATRRHLKRVNHCGRQARMKKLIPIPWQG